GHGLVLAANNALGNPRLPIKQETGWTFRDARTQPAKDMIEIRELAIGRLRLMPQYLEMPVETALGPDRRTGDRTGCCRSASRSRQRVRLEQTPARLTSTHLNTRLSGDTYH